MVFTVTALKQIFSRYFNKMKLIYRKVFLALLLVSLLDVQAFPQKLVESVAGIVGNEVIFLSDVEGQVAQQIASGNKTPISRLRCLVFEQELAGKLFLDQARIDSIEVSDEAIDGQLNLQLNQYIAVVGSEQALEDYFKKSMSEIRSDLKKAMRDQQIIGEVQANIAQDISVTPGEVRRYYDRIPKDSIPKIPEKVQLSIIQLDPPDNEKNKAEARQKLLDIRSNILGGSSFSVQAIMYSEDEGTAKRGGETGYLARGQLEKPYADALFSLNKGGISRIVETRYGFHLIQMIDRMGDMINSRNILIRPKVQPDQAAKALNKLDSIADQIRRDSLKFETAALMYSTHKDSRINGGKYVKNDPSERVTWFTLEELDKETYLVVRDLKVGEISEPFRTVDDDGNTVFRIVKLDDEIPAHEADLKTDYQSLFNAALLEKRSNAYQDWIEKKIGKTYIKVSDEFKTCPFANEG